MIGNALQHVAHIKLRVESVELGRTEQAVNGRSAFAAGVGSGEEIVLATESHGAQGAFGSRVVHLDATIIDVTRERTPTRERIADRRGCVGLARESRKRLVEPAMEIFDQRASPCLADLASVVGWLAAYLTLDVVELAADMRPACRFNDPAAFVKMMESCIAIRLQDAGEVR